MIKKLLTKQEFDDLKRELEESRTVKRTEIAKKLQEAKAQGDLSENAEYSEARDAQSFLEGRIQTIENTLSKAEVVERKQCDFVTVGTKVSVEIDGINQDFEIVGSNGADPAKSRISIESPLGKVLDGLKAGEQTELVIPSGKKTIIIKSVSC